MPLYQAGRALIDPSIIAQMEQSKQNRIANYNNSIDNINRGTREMLGGITDAIQSGITKYQRNNALTDYKQANKNLIDTPEWNAAAQHFYETGDASQLNALKMAEETRQARIAEKNRLDEENAAKEKWHREIRLAQSTPVYDDLLTKFYAASPEEQVAIENRLKALEKEYPELGNSNERKKILAAKAKQDKFNEESHAQRIWYETNVIPTLKNKTHKGEALTQIQNLNLTPEDRKALEDEVRSEQTIGEKRKKGAEDTSVAIQNKKQQEQAEKNQARTEALKKVGQKMNILEFDRLPAEQREFLIMDGQGIVREKK